MEEEIQIILRGKEVKDATDDQLKDWYFEAIHLTRRAQEEGIIQLQKDTKKIIYVVGRLINLVT